MTYDTELETENEFLRLTIKSQLDTIRILKVDCETLRKIVVDYKTNDLGFPKIKAEWLI